METMEEMMERLLAKMEAKTDANLRKTKVEMRTSQKRIEIKIKVSNDKVDFLGVNMRTSLEAINSKKGALVSQIDIHQARTEVIQEK
jgi:multidrug efflux pump subunit AcrB